MLKKVSDLIGAELDYAVAKCEGATNLRENPHRFDKRLIFRLAERTVFMNDFRFSTDWAQGGPIIEREGIYLRTIRKEEHQLYGTWLAAPSDSNTGTIVQWVKRESWPKHYFTGPTSLIAAMRCYVASKFGDKVEIPDEIGAKQ